MDSEIGENNDRKKKLAKYLKMWYKTKADQKNIEFEKGDIVS